MTDRPATGIESLVLDAAPLLVQARIAGLVERRTQALAAVSHDLRTPMTLSLIHI